MEIRSFNRVAVGTLQEGGNTVFMLADSICSVERGTLVGCVVTLTNGTDYGLKETPEVILQQLGFNVRTPEPETAAPVVPFPEPEED